MKLRILEDSINYTCQVIKLPVKIPVQGLDNLVKVNYQGNDCLISKDSDPDILYLFFPCECVIDIVFLGYNNLYRHTNLNNDHSKKGFFTDSGRVKALKLRGVISSGFIIPVDSLFYLLGYEYKNLKVGDEFNCIDGDPICIKYIKKTDKKQGLRNPKTKTIDNIVEYRYAPEHFDTQHLLRNVHKLNLNDYITVSYKLHGTSARYFNSSTNRKLSFLEKISKFLGARIERTEFQYVCASRRSLKSVGFEDLPNKNHWFVSGDLWSEVGKEFFKDKLNEGESVFCEIIGKTYPRMKKDTQGQEFEELGEDIQHGYSYGFQRPKVYIYRISNINSQGIEVDLSYLQMKERAIQLGLEVCPELFYGKLRDFIYQYDYKKFDEGILDSENLEDFLNDIFYNNLLEKPSILDSSVVEEGFCIRIDKYPRPEIYKIKSKNFLLLEGQLNDKGIENIEDQQVIDNMNQE